MNFEITDDTGMVTITRHWATQTIMFALIVENDARLPGPTEVYEQMLIRAQRITDRLFTAAFVACGDGASSETIALCFLRKVLAWVGEWDRKIPQ